MICRKVVLSKIWRFFIEFLTKGNQFISVITNSNFLHIENYLKYVVLLLFTVLSTSRRCFSFKRKSGGIVSEDCTSL